MESNHQIAHCAIVLSLISALLFINHLIDRSGQGLTRTTTSNFEGNKISQRFSLDPCVDFLNWDLRRDSPESRELRVQWEGFLWLERPERLILRSDAAINLEIDGKSFLQKNTDWQFTETATQKPVAAGCHRISIQYIDGFGHSAVSLCRKTGSVVHPISSRNFSPTPIAASTFLYRRISAILWLAGQFLIAASAAFWLWIGVHSPWRRRILQSLSTSYSYCICGLFCFGFLIRLALAIQSGWLILADEAIVGIMGQRIARGGYWPLMYMGQDYGGPLESYFLALIFKVWGSSPIALRMLPLFLSALAIPAIAWAARRCFGKRAALIAAAFWTIPPVMPLIHSMMTMVGPVENVFAAVVAIGFWGTMTKKEKVSPALAALAGFSLGVALWINAQILYVLAPLGLLLTTQWRQRRIGPIYLIFLASFIVGSAPLMAYNIQHPFATLHALTAGGDQKSLLESFIQDFVRQGLPSLLGQKVNWRLSDPLSIWPGYYTPAILAAGVYLFAFVQSLRNGFSKKTPEQKAEALSLFLLVGAITLGVMLFSASGRIDKDPRHLFLLAPVSMILLAWGISALSRKSLFAALSLLALQLICNVQGIWQADPRYYFQPIHKIAEGEYLPADLREAARLINTHKTDGVYADYWLGSNLSFVCEEKIPVCSIPTNRQPDQALFALGGVKPAYVYHANQASYPIYNALLQRLGWRRETALPLILYFAESPLAAPKSKWKVVSPLNDGKTRFAADNILENAWTPNPGDNSLRIDLPSAALIQQVAVIFSGTTNGGDFSLTIDENQNPSGGIKPADALTQFLTLLLFDLPSQPLQTFTLHLPEQGESDPLKIHEIYAMGS